MGIINLQFKGLESLLNDKIMLLSYFKLIFRFFLVGLIKYILFVENLNDDFNYLNFNLILDVEIGKKNIYLI